MNSLFDSLEKANCAPRLNRCYLCKSWHLEKDLQPVEVPDQGIGYIQKLACRKCLDGIISKFSIQDVTKVKMVEGCRFFGLNLILSVRKRPKNDEFLLRIGRGVGGGGRVFILVHPGNDFSFKKG